MKSFWLLNYKNIFFSLSLIYWGDGGVLGIPAKIGVVEMDGSNPKVLLTNGIRSPSYMTIDTLTQSLYFTDTFNRRVS